MSPELKEKLKSHGWDPKRRVDDAHLHTWLLTAVQTYDCHVFPEAVRIMREFGGLVLPNDLLVSSLFPNGLFGEPELWFLWEWTIGEVLFPVACDSYMTGFAVAPDGKIYSNGIAGPHFWGNSFEEMLDIFFSNRKSIEMVEVIQTRMTATVEEESLKIYHAIKLREGVNKDLTDPA